MMKTLRLMAVLIGSLVLPDGLAIGRRFGGSPGPREALVIRPSPSDSSGYLHVVWHNFASGDAEIYLKKSTNGGASWSANQRLHLDSERLL